jgi:hypothetical protein
VGETANVKALTQRIDRELKVIRATPGVASLPTSASLPGIASENHTEVKLTESKNQPIHKIAAESRFTSAEYFPTNQIPLLAGKDCGNSGARHRADASGPQGIEEDVKKT